MRQNYHLFSTLGQIRRLRRNPDRRQLSGCFEEWPPLGNLPGTWLSSGRPAELGLILSWRRPSSNVFISPSKDIYYGSGRIVTAPPAIHTLSVQRRQSREETSPTGTLGNKLDQWALHCGDTANSKSERFHCRTSSGVGSDVPDCVLTLF